MSNLYDKIIQLCKDKGITGGKMCNELSLSRGLMTDLKKGRKKTISTETAMKIANYFDVTVEELYGKKEKLVTISDDELDNEIIKLISALRGNRQKTAINYLRFLVQEQENEASE